MYESILIPTDGSDTAQRAGKYGLELAARYGATVDLLHVLKPSRLEDSAAEAETAEIFDAITDLDIDGEPSVQTHVEIGSATRAIADHVEAEGIDLVVMGRRGLSGVRDHLLGGTADRVLRSVDVPVLTVPGTGVEAATGRTYAEVMCTTDGSEVAERAAPYAAEIAARTSATLHLLTILDLAEVGGPFNAGGLTEADLNRLNAEAESALDGLEAALDAPGASITRTIRKGDTAAEIAAYGKKVDADLLVMASQGRTNLVGQFLGSTTRRVLQRIARPVLVVPTPD
jgi:nucleotide-binding universal stress UspA family protein